MTDFRFDDSLFHFRAERLNGSVRLVVSGELDMSNAWCLEETLVRLQRGGENVTVDLADLTFMGVAGIRLFVEAAKRTHELGGAVTIVNCNPVPLRVFDLMSTLDLPDAWALSDLFAGPDGGSARVSPILAGPDGSAPPPRAAAPGAGGGPDPNPLLRDRAGDASIRKALI